MYFVSYDDRKTWRASPCVTLYKVKETAVKGQTGQIYIGERLSMNDNVKPIMVGERNTRRYVWLHVQM